MKKNSPHWLTYWDAETDLKYLLKARDNIHNVYSEIRSSIGRVLMSEEMLEIQESLEQRIDELSKHTSKHKVAA